MLIEHLQSKINEKWIYRYRTSSALSIKELLYNEIYFAYPDELNDPLDLGAELYFKEGADFIYKFLLIGAFQSINIPRNKKLPIEVEKAIYEVSIQYSRVQRNIKELFTDEHKFWLEEQLKKQNIQVNHFAKLYHNFLNIISNILPSKLLSVSFSKDYDNPLLWSTYAEKHTGYCMIFSPSKNKLKIRDMQNARFKKYELNEVNYSNDINVDLTLMFNESKEFDWDALYNSFFPELIKKALLTKNSNWYKESELRIHRGISISFSHLSQEQERLTSIDRTYYFSPSQLVGIIFGFKMKNDTKKDIIKTFDRKKQSVKIFQAFPEGNKIKAELIEMKTFYKKT